jgi:ubiquinone/menaquinone biosynthesis C-methylase UbiE
MSSQLSFSEMYEQLLVGPLFRPWAKVILEEVALARGNRLLDIACGTDIVARLAKERLGDSGRVVGVDVNPQMLAVTRSVAPGIDWREGSAAALPLQDDEQFDTVTCQQGLQFLPDRRAAAREMRNALAPGGMLAVATWRPTEEIPLLREAGIREVRVKTVSRTMRFTDAPAFVRLNTMALVGMSTASKGMSDEERRRAVAAIASDSGKVLPHYTNAAGLAFEISTNVATGIG